MKIQKGLTLLLVGLLALALVACGGGEKREKYDLTTPDGTVKEVIRAYNEGDWDHLKEFIINGDQFFADREAWIASLGYDEASTAALNETIQAIDIAEITDITDNEFLEGSVYVSLDTWSFRVGDQILADLTAHAGSTDPMTQDFENVNSFLSGFSVSMVQVDKGWKLHLDRSEKGFTDNYYLANLFLGDTINGSQEWVEANNGTPPLPAKEISIGDYTFMWPE